MSKGINLSGNLFLRRWWELCPSPLSLVSPGFPFKRTLLLYYCLSLSHHLSLSLIPIKPNIPPPCLCPPPPQPAPPHPTAAHPSSLPTQTQQRKGSFRSVPSAPSGRVWNYFSSLRRTVPSALPACFHSEENVPLHYFYSNFRNGKGTINALSEFPFITYASSTYFQPRSFVENFANASIIDHDRPLSKIQHV